jgi:predicted ribosomally synthesized peptide with SipW-like signal peptide
MSLRKVAGLLGAFVLSIGLVGGGVSAAFTDQVTAVQNVSIGTFSCQITNTTAGTIAPDGKSLDYVVPSEIQAYPGSAPFSFTVANTGTIPVSMTVSSWGLQAPFTSILATPGAPVTVAAGATQVYDAGIAWVELGMADLGKSASIHYVVTCGEVRFASTPAISFFSAPNYAGDGYLHDWITGVGFAPGPLTVSIAYQFGSPLLSSSVTTA